MMIFDKNDNGLPIFAPSFEHALNLNTCWKGYLYTAAAGVLNIYDEVLTGDIYLRGGWYQLVHDATPDAVKGDYIEFSLVDKDDVLGLFATYGLTVGIDVLELKKYVNTEYINPYNEGRSELFISKGAIPVVAGLYLRIYYNSTGADDVDFKVTILKYE